MTSAVPDRAAPFAYLGGILATDLTETADLAAEPGRLSSGWWAVVAGFEGAVTGYRFGTVRTAAMPTPHSPWPGITGSWASSLSREQYLAGVEEIRRRIARGDVYQVNLCRLLSTELDSAATYDPLALAAILARGNPSKYQGVIATDAEWLVTASPELFLERDGDIVRSAPIKGTAAPGAQFAEKDTPENVMICDLVRNDLGRIAATGSVTVTSLLAREDLPGLAHLVSTVEARMRPEVTWADLLTATMPPGSVSGAPKHTALQAISELEPVPRGPYCGAVGYVDGEAGVAQLAVGIRTFYTSGGGRRLHFGTGAGITYLSDAEAEWAETELKAQRLIALANGGEAAAPR